MKIKVDVSAKIIWCIVFNSLSFGEGWGEAIQAK